MTTLRPFVTATVAVPALVLALTGCGRHNPVAPAATGTRTLAAAPAATLALGEPQHVEGNTGPGSIYALDVPADWNGDLVLYAHGITLPATLPVALPNHGRIRDLLLARGFAVAASSFDENGYAVKDGVQRTHQLIDLFTGRFGPPRRVFLVGVSLGGIIALDLAETHPEQFAGCLSVAGVTGGTLPELDYVATVRVLFDCVYPGVLPGTLYDVPPITDFNRQVAGPVLAAIAANPQGVGVIAALEPRLPYRSSQELVQSILNALAFQTLGANDLADRVHGHSFFDNQDKVYTGPLPPEVLAYVNAHVARYSMDPDARSYLTHYYTPSGDLRIPVVTLHHRWDPMVPLFNEDLFTAAATRAGRADMLRRHVIDGYGHDAFTGAEIAAAFDELVSWAGSGSRPLP